MDYKIRLNSIENAVDFVTVCSDFDCDVDYIMGSQMLDAKSIVGVLSTDLSKEAVVRVHTNNSVTLKLFEKCIERWKENM